MEDKLCMKSPDVKRKRPAHLLNFDSSFGLTSEPGYNGFLSSKRKAPGPSNMRPASVTMAVWIRAVYTTAKALTFTSSNDL